MCVTSIAMIAMAANRRLELLSPGQDISSASSLDTTSLPLSILKRLSNDELTHGN
jgi:hypothetical protein